MVSCMKGVWRQEILNKVMIAVGMAGGGRGVRVSSAGFRQRKLHI